MRLSNLKSAICGTEKLVVEDIEIVTLEVPIEDAEGNEGTFREDEWHIKVRPYKRDARRCPECGRKCPGYDQQDLRAWRTVDVGTSRCHLHYAPARVRCPEHGPIVEAVPWADHKAKLTRAMDEQIAWAMCHLCRSAVRELFRVADVTVGNACDRVLRRCVDQDELLEGLRCIGIDEL